ncbi:MAG: histidine kinase [bacterium]
MNNIHKILLRGAAVLVFGAFISFILLAKTDSTWKALSIGYFYAASAFLVFALVHKLVAAKLSVFSTGQQLILRTLLYTIAISFAYLAGFVFQTIVLLPFHTIQEAVIDNAWKGFVYLVSSPFGGQAQAPFLSLELRALSVPFFAMIFLIGLVSMVGSFVEIRWQETRQRQAVERAELTALRAQIEPHFLFNSLNTIASLVKKDADKAEKLLIQLSEILRYFFQGSTRDTIELEHELNFTRQYLALLSARFGEDLQIEWRETLDHPRQKVPVLLIQPIIENSIRHGWQDRDTPLRIRIEVAESDKSIRLKVSDNGKGIKSEMLKEIPIYGHALANISERLHLQFKEDELLRINSELDKGTIVEMTIPIEEKTEAG